MDAKESELATDDGTFLFKERLSLWGLRKVSIPFSPTDEGLPPVYKGPPRVLEIGCGDGNWCFKVKSEQPDWIVEGIDDTDHWLCTNENVILRYEQPVITQQFSSLDLVHTDNNTETSWSQQQMVTQMTTLVEFLRPKTTNRSSQYEISTDSLPTKVPFPITFTESFVEEICSIELRVTNLSSKMYARKYLI